MFFQSVKSVENLYGDVAGNDMSSGDFNEISRKAWEKGSIYLQFPRSKQKDDGSCCASNENKTTYHACVPRTKIFSIFQKLYSSKIRGVLGKVVQLVSLRNQLKDLVSQDKIGKQ